MKTRLNHLPEQKQDELKTIVRMIREEFDVEMIILFGSYARGDWVEELGPDEFYYTYQSDWESGEVFPKGTEEERNRFELLRKAYVDARYDEDYKISREELEWLGERVKKLQKLTEDICTKKIDSFDNKASR